MAELGVPLTRDIGFHQFDVCGNVFGLLAAHPIAPLVSLHHLDVIDPIFPNVNQVEALQRLKVPKSSIQLASCNSPYAMISPRNGPYQSHGATRSNYLGALISARLIERPARTFLNWYPDADQVGFEFNSRPVSDSICESTMLYLLSKSLYNPSTNQTAKCKGGEADPSQIHRVEVCKKPNPNMWDK
ncbi:hypothetical protein RJ639_044862, partial [Escallonia herrerae]